MGNDNVKGMFKRYIDSFCEREVSWKQHNFWTFLFTSWKNDELFELLDIESIRKLRKEQPSNLGMLLFKCLEQIILYSKEEDENTEQLCMRNSIMYLNRIIPILFEHNNDNFFETFFVHNVIPSFRKKELRKFTDKNEAKKKKDEEDESEEGEEGTDSEEGEIDESEEGEDDLESNEEVGEKEGKENSSGFIPFDPKNKEEKKKIPPVRKESNYVEKKSVFKELTIEEEIKEEVKDIIENVISRGTGSVEIKRNDKKKEEMRKKIKEISLEPLKSGNKVKNIGNEMLTIPMFKKLIYMLMQALFLPEYSIPKSQIKPTFKRVEGLPEGLDVNLMWEGGLVVPRGKFQANAIQLENRKNVLRTLLTCCSSSLFSTQINLNMKDNLFLKALCSPSAPFSANLFYSALNIIGAYNPTGSLPYSSVIFNDSMEEISLLSIQFLTLMLCNDVDDNVYVKYVKGIKRKKDFKFLYDMFSRLLKNSIDSDNTYLPGSQKRIIFEEELYVLFWKMLQHNHNFRFYICRSEEITKLLTCVLYAFYKNSKNIQQFPFLQVIGFVLLLLSEERLFAVAMNKRYAEKIPVKLPLFKGNYFDFLVILFHKMIVEDSKLIVKPLLNCLMTIFHNISPYAKTLSITTTAKLLNLFELFSNVRFLYANDTNYDLVFLLLHSFNNLIQYQYNGNVNLVYSIMRKQKAFKNLMKPVNLKKVTEVLRARKIKFTPTESWVRAWKVKLPVEVIRSVLNTLVPEVEKFCANNTATEEDVLKYLRNTTLVGVLPVPHSIVVRTLFVSPRIQTFLIVYCWSLIYIKELGYTQSNFHHYDPKKIKLFTVKSKH